MLHPAEINLSGAIQSAVTGYERLHLLRGITTAGGTPAALFHQSWIRLLWNSVYDATIIAFGALLDNRSDSHGLRSLAQHLRAPEFQDHLPLICDLELAVDRLQSPYDAIIAVRNKAVAHHSVGHLQPIDGPTLDALAGALDNMFELLSRVSDALQSRKLEIDVENMRKLSECTARVLLSGMSASLPPGVVLAKGDSTSNTRGASTVALDE